MLVRKSSGEPFRRHRPCVNAFLRWIFTRQRPDLAGSRQELGEEPVARLAVASG